jgi:hypothetical protein
LEVGNEIEIQLVLKKKSQSTFIWKNCMMVLWILIGPNVIGPIHIKPSNFLCHEVHRFDFHKIFLLFFAL